MTKSYFLFTLFCILFVFCEGLKAQDIISGKSNTITLDPGGKDADSKASPVVIDWISPETNEQELSKEQFTVEVGINAPSPVLRMELLLNYETVDDNRGFKKQASGAVDQYDSRFSREVHLSGGLNTLSVAVETEAGERAVAHRKVIYNKDEGLKNILAQRQDKALLFATNEYNSWNDLNNPVYDAKTIAEELEKYYGFEVEIVLNPTYKEVLSKIKAYTRKDFGKYDQLFIFFAGHGQFDKSFKEGYVVCKDSEKEDETKSTYIAHSNLRTYINNIPCNHIFLTMDVCFGGTFDRAIARGGGNARGGEGMYNGISNPEFIKRKLRFKTRKFITSGGKTYVPDGRPGHHSPFARKFIKALRSYGGHDQILTLGELKTYLERVKPEPRAGEFGQNEPGSGFVFVAEETGKN